MDTTEYRNNNSRKEHRSIHTHAGQTIPDSSKNAPVGKVAAAGQQQAVEVIAVLYTAAQT